MEALAGSTEIRILGWSVILLLVHIVIQALSLIKDGGVAFAMSNRDGEIGISLVTERLTRGLRNFVETYGAYIALVVALSATGKVGGLAATGALVWFWARVVYVPVFAFGIPVARTLVWTVSIVGLVLMLVRLLG